TLNSCKDECQDPRNPDCENYNPCIDAKPTSAAFTIKEATVQQINSPNLTDFLMDTDSCYMSSIFFEATQADADSFIWQIGTEPQPRYGKQVNVVFPDNLRGTNFNVRLIVKRKPNTRCFPTDDGIDTLTRRFYFVRYNEPLSWEGSYYGSDDDKPDSMYTIVLGHSYDVAEEEDIIKVVGIPRGCRDTINEWIPGVVTTYKNIGFERVGIDCSAKIVLGVYNEGNKYRIIQGYRTFTNGVLTKKNRIFTGIKIN
ncbi:MAG: hypothetical protein MUE96_07285, partial [Bacteroidia bacterium]|nr:hypothetical protein [Bacteroidia bacterium]